MLTFLLHKKNWIKIPIYLLLSILFASVPKKQVFATSVVGWTDNFTFFNENRWLSFDENGNNLIVNNDFLKSSYIGTLSSFVILQQPITYNNVLIEIKFRYLDEDYNYGTGISVNDNPIPRRVGMIFTPQRTISVWPQTRKRLAVASSICLKDASCSFNDATNSKPIIIGGESFHNWHILKIKYFNKKYYVSLDGIYSFETKPTNRRPNYIWFGNPEDILHTVVYSKFLVDYVRVEDLDKAAEFPYLSQKDPQWANEEYDQASTWAPSGHQTIANWGCALTSSAMIFQHFGVKSPTSQTTTPLVLNTWLKNQTDGYVKNGLVNWLALTRYAKEARDAGYSPTSLEFATSNYNPNTTYQTPNIINLPGHFVVGYDQDNSNFKIKDPADKAKTSLAKTGTLIKRINRFIPSNTDLSYFMFTINPKFNIQVTNDNGDVLGQVFEQEPLKDDLDASSSASQNNLKTLLVAKPPHGNFHLTITNPTQGDLNYSLTEYFYDTAGKVEVKSESQHLLSGHSDVYDFNYNGQVGTTQDPITIESIKKILDTYFNKLQIKDFYYRFVANWLETAKNEPNAQKQKEIMQALGRVVENNITLIEMTAKTDIQKRINQWLSNH